MLLNELNFSAFLYSVINSHIQNSLLATLVIFIVFSSIVWSVPNQAELVDVNLFYDSLKLYG